MMIIVDRPLTIKEAAEVDGHQVYHVPNSNETNNLHSEQIYEWIDTIDKVGINDLAPLKYYSWKGQSFWLHIRARLFNRLLEHAQFLDQIADLNVFEDSSITVYTTSKRSTFWKKWCLHASCVLDEGVNPTTSSPQHMKRVRNAIKNLITESFPNNKSIDYLFFSPSRNTLEIDGKLHDKTFESLYEELGDAALRIEYQILPNYIPSNTDPDYFNLPRKSQTIPTDTALLSHLIRKPWLVAEMLQLVLTYSSKFCRYRSTFKFNYKDEVWTHLINEYISSFKMSVVQLLFFNSVFEEIIQRYNPKAVVATGESNSIGRCFIEAAKKHLIPTFGVQHGDLPENNIDYRYNSEVAAQAKTDYFFYWGEESKEILINQAQYTPEQLIPVGQLEFEQIKPRIKSNKEVEAFKKEMNVPTLLFASQKQQSADSRIKTAQALASFCAENKIACVLKLHPAEPRDGLHKKIFAEHGISHLIVEVNDDIYNLIYSTDFTSTCYSTTAWEAMSMKKPVIIIDPLELNLLGLKDEESVYYIGGVAPIPFDEWLEKMNRHLSHAYSLSYQKLGDREGSPSQKVLGFINSVVGA